MGQADSYIRRVRNECKLSHLEDIFDLYDLINFLLFIYIFLFLI